MVTVTVAVASAPAVRVIREVRIYFYYPEATRVAVTGDFNGWNRGSHPLARDGFGVWSLVIGYIVDLLLTSLLAWVVSPLRPRIRFDPGIAREMFDYGKHLQLSQVLIFLITNLDNAFVGRVRGEDDLGVYSVAYTLSNLPATHTMPLVSPLARRSRINAMASG